MEIVANWFLPFFLDIIFFIEFIYSNHFKIDDENLKVSILREILECQRLLLTIHARKQNVHSQLLYDIYEEWKILAIIVDRICFVFYLFSMLAASIIFFVREPILKRNR